MPLLLLVVSCCGKVSQQIVHLRTPKETTVGKIVDSCLKMLGMTEDKSLFAVKDKEGREIESSGFLTQNHGDIIYRTFRFFSRFIRGALTRTADWQSTESLGR